MDNKYYEEKLQNVGIRVTSVRLLVLKTIHTKMHGAFSLQDVMSVLYQADNSSVFRALSLFAEKRLLHLIDDGSGVQKYCVCHCDDHSHSCRHVHFTCVECHDTVCLNDIPIPMVSVPEEYHVIEAEYVIKGICPKCQKKLKM